MSTGNLTLTAAGTPTDLANRLGAGVKCVLGREEIAAIRSLAWLVMLVESNPFAGFDVNVGLEVAFLRRDASLSPISTRAHAKNRAGASRATRAVRRPPC